MDTTTDEDEGLFLEEFIALLNKYHYVIPHRFQIAKFYRPEDCVSEILHSG